MTGSLRKTAAHNLACGASRQIDSRWGEKYFAEHLNDFDLAANNGGWQWAASTGCDAQPYFRIFIPVTQSEKFDLDGKFIRRYLPELGGLSGAAIHAPWLAGSVDIASAGITLGKQYPKPIWEHAAARTTALAMYGLAKKKKSRQANNERWSLIRSKSTNGQIR